MRMMITHFVLVYFVHVLGELHRYAAAELHACGLARLDKRSAIPLGAVTRFCVKFYHVYLPRVAERVQAPEGIQ